MTKPEPKPVAADLKRARRRATPTDRLPPHSNESEQGILGCVLLSPREALTGVHKAGFVTDEFYDLRHQTIYQAVCGLEEERKEIDVITLQQRLKDCGMLEQVGGIPYLNSLQDAVPSAANVGYYLDIVQEKATLRRVVQTCKEAADRVYLHEGTLNGCLDEFERAALSVRRKRVETTSIQRVVGDALATIEEKFNQRGAIRGLSTGFPDLDRVLDGLCPADLIVPAAYPSGGKTSLSMNFAEHLVMSLKVPVAVFTLEMTAEQLAVRMITSHAKVNVREIEGMDDDAFTRIGSSAAALSASGLHIVEDAFSISAIMAEARRLHQEHGVRLVVVDYIQLVEFDSGKKEANRAQDVGGVALALKRLAKELKVPVVAPSQLNDDGKLFDSRAIGHHCDVMLVLKSGVKKPARKQDEDEIAGNFADVEPVNVFVKKNRNGRRGVTVKLTFLKTFTRFESAAKVSEEDVPANNQEEM